ncbi:uncharacterized protein [Amphiura filiformis]|uniref:uncharacterized protein n=1 Tax=Amphiura filiformis TaxID=82378 RepID=UPI003B21054E
MAFMTVNGSMNGGNTRPLVLYISVHSPNEHSNDGRQRVFENLQVANAFPQVEFRPFRINGDSIFDDIMSLLLSQLTADDFQRLQMIVVNGYAQVQTGTLGGESFTGAFFKVILLALLHRFPSHNNNTGHKIAVVCAQCFSHIFVQQAESVPAKNPVFKFIPLTNSYMPYLLHTEDMPKVEWMKWDTQLFLKKLLVAPRSPASPTSPSITIMR